MQKEIFTFLKSYSFIPSKIDRLIVSSFLYSNNLTHTKNSLLNDLLIKKGDVDYQAVLDFLKIDSVLNFEQLVELFEFVVSPEDKIVTGAVYTPKEIRNFIVENSLLQGGNLEQVKICDPACGCSGFLYTAAKFIKNETGRSYESIFEKNIFGLDIQDYSVRRSKILLSLLAVYENEDLTNFTFNFFHGNALNFEWDKHIRNFAGFDVILGNPPYVCSRNIELESKQYLSKWSVCDSGHPDLYIPFFEIGLTYLKNNGILGYITMNSFFKSINGRALRKYFEEMKFNIKILDFGGHQIFQSKSTYTCICLIQKIEGNGVNYCMAKSVENLISNNFEFKLVPYSSLNVKNGWNLQEIEILAKIESTGTKLGDLYKSRNGIATLKNEIFIFDPVREDKRYYYLKSKDLSLHKIEKGICNDIINPNMLTKLDSLRTLKEKIIFPYYFKNEKVKLLSEERFSSKYPYAYEYLTSKKNILAKRDKGKGKYEKWYAFGRNQSLERLKNKLFFPHIAPYTPNFVINTDENLLFYNGIAIIGKTKKELNFLQKLLSTRLFWFYITNSSKHYSSGYYSLSRNYIKGFGIYNFTKEEIDKIINEGDQARLNKFIESKYGISLV